MIDTIGIHENLCDFLKYGNWVQYFCENWKTHCSRSHGNAPTKMLPIKALFVQYVVSWGVAFVRRQKQWWAYPPHTRTTIVKLIPMFFDIFLCGAACWFLAQALTWAGCAISFCVGSAGRYPLWTENTAGNTNWTHKRSIPPNHGPEQPITTTSNRTLNIQTAQRTARRHFCWRVPHNAEVVVHRSQKRNDKLKLPQYSWWIIQQIRISGIAWWKAHG